MTDKLIATITIEPDEVSGKFYYSLDGGETRVGPYDSEEEAADASSDFLGDAFAQLAKKTLFGE